MTMVFRTNAEMRWADLWTYLTSCWDLVFLLVCILLLFDRLSKNVQDLSCFVCIFFPLTHLGWGKLSGQNPWRRTLWIPRHFILLCFNLALMHTWQGYTQRHFQGLCAFPFCIKLNKNVIALIPPSLLKFGCSCLTDTNVIQVCRKICAETVWW